jgi:hypothetical protein
MAGIDGDRQERFDFRFSRTVDIPADCVVSAGELMFRLQPIEDPLDGMSLLLRGGESVLQDLLDDLLEIDRERSLGSGGGAGCTVLARLLAALGGS